MGFSQKVADEVFVRCSRHCCLCGSYSGAKMELHHIKQVADGGDDSVENCIPLCFNCHAEVKAYNPHHPKGRKFSEAELKGHRDKYYALFSSLPNPKVESEENEAKNRCIFEPKDSMPAPFLWGYPKQDENCYLLPGKMLLIAGHTGTKKSAYVQHIVNTNLSNGLRVVYCCLKDNPFNVGIEIIAENACLNSNSLKRGELTENDWKSISLSRHNLKSENLALVSYNEAGSMEQILSIVENSGAEIVVVDDINGILSEDNAKVEHFMYQLKSATSKSNTLVIAIYNMLSPIRRGDMHPMLCDFPSDNYYRLFDIVQFMFCPSNHYEVEQMEGKVVEAIFVKGASTSPYIVKMYAANQITHVYPVDV